MLAPSRNHRVEAKFNVSTDFPHLGLHSAAVSGDIGLVQYALSHGQPVNSVLDGVLPLHAACAGGNDLVVELLIKHGADVNASRLPRRYSDRSRDSAAPIVGTSGATPLHFAAANGHASVVRTLLLHGAHPNRPDKHGITPEIIARQNGWIECADILANENQARARGENTPDSDGHSSRERCHPTIEHLESSLRKKLHFKRSIDHALSALKGSPDIDPSTRPSCFRSNSSEQDVSPPPDSIPAVVDSSGRRPSLPHVHDEPPQRPSLPKTSRRPRSAGTGAEATPPRKLNSKLSLLSLFKKSNIDGSSSSVTTVSEPPINSPPSSSPVPVQGTASPASNVANLPSPRIFPTQLSFPPRDTSTLDHRRRLESNAARDVNPWHRSASSSSTPGEDKDTFTESPYPTSASVRPGILRMHNRSSSSQGSQPASSSSSRIIRFDNASSTASSSLTATATRARSPPGLYDNRLRTLSMGSSAGGGPDTDRIPDTIEESPLIPYSPPPIFVNAAELEEEDEGEDEDEEEEEYGVPIAESVPDTMLTPDRAVSGVCVGVPTQFPFSINVPPPDDSGTASESRLRGDSVGSAGTASTSTTTYTQSSSSDATWPLTPHFSGASPLISSRSMDVDTDMGPGEGPSPRVRRSHSNLGLGLDFSSISISSRADVEALVQRAQQSVLDMEADLEASRRRNEAGRTALSAQLAMFGESLAIERMMKEQEEEEACKFGSGTVNEHGHERSLLSTSRPGHSHGVNGASAADPSLRMHMSRSSSGSGASSDDTSLEHRTLTVSRDIRQTTSGDISRMPSADMRQPMTALQDTQRTISDDTRRTRSPPVAPRHLPLPHPHTHQHPLPLPSPRTKKSLEAFAYTPPRAHTPDPFDADADADVLAGMPLSRVSTAPTHARSPPTHAAARSVNKLSRMGFSSAEGYGHGYGYGWQPSPVPLGVMGSPPKQRFGGIRTIVRGFQGK